MAIKVHSSYKYVTKLGFVPYFTKRFNDFTIKHLNNLVLKLFQIELE